MKNILNCITRDSILKPFSLQTFSQQIFCIVSVTDDVITGAVHAGTLA